MGDLLDGVAQIFLMVEVDIGDHRNSQIERVRRVQPPSEANLANQKVDPRREESESHRSQHFEFRRLAHLGPNRIERGYCGFERLDEVRFGNGTSVELDALRV